MAFILMSLAITPPIMVMLLFFNITDQSNGQSKEDAQAEVLKKLIQHPLVWLWVMYISFMLFLFNN